MKRNIILQTALSSLLAAFSLLAIPESVFADPIKVESPALKKIAVKPNRAMGRLFIRTNFSSHRILVDGAEYPAYLDETGIEITSNELHEITVSKGDTEKSYKLSLNPNESLVLFVDLGGKDAAAAAPAKKDKKDAADNGFLNITAESEAQIYIDGKLISSKTPLNKHEVTSGSHTVRVYFFDTRKFSKSREVYVGKGVTMSLNFTKE